MSGTAIVHITLDGWSLYYATPGVRMLVIDETCPRDRVLEIIPDLSDAKVAQLVGGCRVGRLGDMPGTEAAIAAMLNGEPAPTGPSLTVIERATEDGDVG